MEECIFNNQITARDYTAMRKEAFGILDREEESNRTMEMLAARMNITKHRAFMLIVDYERMLVDTGRAGRA